MTTQPTIAEIVGKTADGAWPHDGRKLPDDVVAWTCPACGKNGERGKCAVDWRDAVPAVDDMLAWIQGRGWHITAEPNVLNQWVVTVIQLDDEDVTMLVDGSERWFRAPTLSKAVAATVRGVAG